MRYLKSLPSFFLGLLRKSGQLKTRYSKILIFYILFAPFVLWLFLLLFLPQLELLFLSFSSDDTLDGRKFTTEQYSYIFTGTLYVSTLIRTLIMSLITTVLTLLISFPVAFYIAKVAKGRGKMFLFFACILPFWASEMVRIFGWLITLRETGLLSSFLIHVGVIDKPVEFLYNDVTIIVGLVYTNMLFMLIPLVSAIDTIEDSIIEAAYDLGSSFFAIIRKIVIPHTLPSIVAGSIIVFMFSLGSYFTPEVLGGKNGLWFTQQIYTQFIDRFDWNLGSAFGITLLLTSTVIVWLGLVLSRQSFSKTFGK